MEQEPKLTKKDQEAIQSMGGADKKEKPQKDENYCDKGGHRERSLANQPNHQDHWKKTR
jgi:hypothetical protein